MKSLKLIFAILLTVATSALADTVYVTGSIQPSGGDPNPDGSYTELVPFSGGTSAFSTAPGSPPRTTSRFRAVSAFTNGEPFIRITPTLGVPGGVYRVFYTHSSTANNTITNSVIGFTNVVGATLSFDQTTAFNRAFGQPAPQKFIYLGNLTNDPGSATPSFDLFLKSSTDTGTLRLLFDTMRFTLDDPCLNVDTVNVTGPLSTNSSTVVVAGVSSNATAITIYQDSGAGMVEIGSSTNVTGGVNTVTASNLVMGAMVAATQTIGEQQGCVPTSGTIVGGGANPRFRLALSVRPSTTPGPVGAVGTALGTTIHFLGASTVSAGAPLDSTLIEPSNNWQTVTFDRGTVLVGSTANVVGEASESGGYNANDSVSISVYPFKTVPDSGTLIYSRTGAQSAAVTSNGVFGVNWSWNAVPDAEGYRLVRSSTTTPEYTNTFTDIFATTFQDNNNVWQGGAVVLPNVGQTNASIQWNPSVGANNTLTNQWYILEALAISLEDEDTGPFDFYVDNIQNGSAVVQNFEQAISGRLDFGFRAPTFSGTTSGNVLPAPNVGEVSNLAADTGTKSFRVQFQWSKTNAPRWLRLTTSGVGNPLINLDQPVSLRLLVPEVGFTPVPPPAPEISIAKDGDNVILNWEGAHRLLEAVNVEGPYSTNAATVGPVTNTATGQKFFRLKD